MRFRFIPLTVLAILICALSVFAKPNTLIRDEIDDAYKWDLSHIYADWDAWETDYAELKNEVNKLKAYKGNISNNADQLAAYLNDSDQAWRTWSKLYVYPFLKTVEDSRKNEVQAYFQRANHLANSISQATSWYSPELMSIGKEKVMAWIKSTPALEPHKFNLTEAFRLQEHVLDPKSEELLSMAGGFYSTPSETYEMMSTADVKYPTVTLSDGTEMVATYGNYQMVQHTSNVQADRQAMMEAYYSVYNDYENVYASIANSIFQRNWYKAKTRGYNSTLEQRLDSDAIPVAVYTTLVETAKKGSAPLQRYHQIRKEVLGLDTYCYYDAYLPLVEADVHFNWEEAKENVAASVKPLGKDYQKELKRAYDERWIDVYENEGKPSGAFNQGLYDVHPYVKMNYNDTMNDMFTLAHELGHSMHSVYSSKTQPYPTAHYATFIAEVASITNEYLLMDHLLDTIKDPKVRVALLQQSIDGIAGTFYRQAMFADYELKAHTLVEEGNPITAQILQNIYLDSQSEFFGDDLDNQDLYRNTWAYVSHYFFETPYYVFQYATSKSASAKIHSDLTTGKKKDRKAALARYTELISAGGSDQPVTLLQNAGVDMTQEATYQALVDQMDELVNQLEKELVKLDMIER